MLPDAVLYLVHSTNVDPKTISRLEPPSCEHATTHQFPGVFFTLITKHNRGTESIYPGKHVLVFSASLLLQHNFHINIQDHNGFLSEHNTFYPWQLNQAVKALSKSTTHTNEVVFHDAVDVAYMCRAIERPRNSDPNFLQYIMNGGVNAILPNKRLVGTRHPDMSKIPFYAHAMEHLYTGIPLGNGWRPSSMAWYRKMADLACLSHPRPRKKSELIKLLEQVTQRLCRDRAAQNFDALGISF